MICKSMNKQKSRVFETDFKDLNIKHQHPILYLGPNLSVG